MMYYLLEFFVVGSVFYLVGVFYAGRKYENYIAVLENLNKKYRNSKYNQGK